MIEIAPLVPRPSLALVTSTLDTKSTSRALALDYEDPNKTPASSTRLGFTLKMSSPGFKNIRAMFEQGNAQPTSGSTTPNREISPKNLTRVRTSFVAVAANGGVGLIKAGSPIAGGTEVSIAEAAKLAGEAAEKGNVAPLVEEKEKKEVQAPAPKAEDIQPPVEEMKSVPEVKVEEEQKVEPENTPPAPKETAKPSSDKPSSKSTKTATDTKTQSSKERPKTAPSSSKLIAEKRVTVKASPVEKKPVKPVEEKKVLEKKAAVPTTTKPVKPVTTKPASSRPATTKATFTKPPPKNLSLPASSTTKKSSTGTPLASPRVAATPKTPTTTKPVASATAKPRASDKSSAAVAPKVRASTAIGHRSKTPSVSDIPRKTTTAVSSSSRLFAPTASSQARGEKEKAKTVASSTVTKRPASVAANRPKSSLSTHRYGDSKVTSSVAPRTGTAAKSAPVKKTAASAAPPEAPKAEAATTPPPPPEEVLERVTRPTAASAQKVVSKEELAEIHSRSSSRVSGGTHSRRVSVGSTSSTMGSPGKRRLSSQSPPRLVISPAQPLNGEEPTVIEEKPEEEQEGASESATEEAKPKPPTLEINAGEKVEAQDVSTPTSETTLVQESEIAEKVEEEVAIPV